jgi:hypothetical protein
VKVLELERLIREATTDAVNEERARIIALLSEERGAHPVGWDYTDWLIALIEGDIK